jgi:serine/threonine protein phosphatase PrpC
VEAAVAVLQASGLGADRALAVPTAQGYLLALADGAGNSGSGAVAAERVVQCVAELTEDAGSADWFDVLLALDDELSRSGSGGQTTAAVACVSGNRITGASVGDSSAWIVSRAGEVTDLTARQRRRPLLGSGEALPVVFEAELNGSRLLIATDGLTKYATVEHVCALALQGTVSEAADALANCVRLPSGAVPDDVAVVLVSR